MNVGVHLVIVSVVVGLVWVFRVWYSNRRKMWSASAAALELYRRGDFASAEKAFRKLADVCERTHGAEHMLTAANRNHLANSLIALERPEVAAVELQQVLAIRMRLLGMDHADTISSRHSLATALHAMGSMEEAEMQFRQVLAARERLLGPENNDVLKTCYALALSLEDQSRDEEAMRFARRCEVVWGKTLGDTHPATVRARIARERIEVLAMTAG